MKLAYLLHKRPSLQWPAHALGLWEAYTQTSKPERDALVDLARGRSSLAETGVFQGVTTRLLTTVMDPDGTYFAVDPYAGGKLGIDFSYFIARREVAQSARARRVSQDDGRGRSL